MSHGEEFFSKVVTRENNKASVLNEAMTIYDSKTSTSKHHCALS